MRLPPQSDSGIARRTRRLQELISKLATQLGIDELIARKAAGMILSLLQKVGDDATISELFEKVPGAAELAELESGPVDAAGGLMGMLGGLMGGNTGDVMATFSALQSEGLSNDQIKSLGTGLLSHARECAGDELVDRTIEGVPGFQQYL
ncbi:MAG: DUF2780 domain-containing protein [Hyphomicrobiales bacterium]